MSVLDQLKQYANTVRYQTKKEMNTAELIGSILIGIIDYLFGLSNGYIRQPGVDTYNDTSGGKTSLLNSYPTPSAGWTVLVRNDETNSGKSILYQWNGSQWVNLETAVYTEDVVTSDMLLEYTQKGGYDGTAHDINNNMIKSKYNNAFTLLSIPFATAQPNKGISETSAIVYSATYGLTDYIPVPDGAKTLTMSIDIEATAGYDNKFSTLVGIYDINKQPLGKRLNKYNGNPYFINTNVVYDIPEGCKFVVFYQNGGGKVYPMKYGFDIPTKFNLFDDKNGVFFDIVEELRTRPILYSEDVTVPYTGINDRKTVDTSGNLVSSTSFNMTDPVEVVSAKKYSIKQTVPISTIFGYFDANMGALGRGSLTGDDIITMPIDCKYIVLFKNRLNTSGNITETFNYNIHKQNSNILQLEDGSISYNLDEFGKSETQFLPRPANGIVNFSIPVNCNNADVDSETLNTQDTLNEHNDWGILQLPVNYSQTGSPVRLVISCHGTGTWINQNTSSINSAANFLLSQGFAVMDMNGIPASFAGSTGTDNGKRHYGAPFAQQSYIKGYHWVLERYNVAKDGCLVYGISMGGLSSFQVVLSGSIPVIAQGAFCPCIDLFKQAYCNPWNSGTVQRADISQYFGFDGVPPTFTNNNPPTQAEIDYFKNNVDKVIGYVPIWKEVVGLDTTEIMSVIPESSEQFNEAEAETYNKYSRIYPVPLKVWHNLDDTTVRYRYSQYLVNMIKNAGGMAFLRTFPSGGHNAWENGETVTNIPTISGGTTSTPTSIYELFLWFKRFL